MIEKLGITPGPWKYDGIVTSTDKEQFPICYDITNEKDGDLIAAAPEMLKALILSVELEVRIIEEKCFVKIYTFNDIEENIYSGDAYGVECLEDLKRKFKVVEKICHPKTWEEIKELI